MIINDKGLRLEEIDRCFDCFNKGGCQIKNEIRELKGKLTLRLEYCENYKQSEIKYKE